MNCFVSNHFGGVKPMLQLIVLLTILFPIAWFVSEFQSRQWLRVMLGCCAIAMSFGVAWLAGSLETLNYNAWYSTATQQLVKKTLQELEAGHESSVIDNLQWINQRYQPNYETGLVDYERLVETYIERFGTADN
jgi:hypothetical protein